MVKVNIIIKIGNIRYDGDFINDKYEGNGKYNYINGEYYIGKWKNDKKMVKVYTIIKMVIYVMKETLLMIILKEMENIIMKMENIILDNLKMI